MINKLIIALDIENIWEEWGSIRDVFYNMSIDKENVEIYIVTKSTNAALITNISTILNLNMSTNVFYSIVDNNALKAKLLDLNVQIFMSGDSEFVESINIEHLIVQAITVNSIQDSYNLQPKWFTVLGFFINQIAIGSGQTKSC